MNQDDEVVSLILPISKFQAIGKFIYNHPF